MKWRTFSQRRVTKFLSFSVIKEKARKTTLSLPNPRKRREKRGLRDGGLSKSEDIWGFPGAVWALQKKAEKGRKRPISTDFREGRPDTP